MKKSKLKVPLSLKNGLSALKRIIKYNLLRRK